MSTASDADPASAQLADDPPPDTPTQPPPPGYAPAPPAEPPPTEVTGQTNVTHVSAGGEFSLAVHKICVLP